MTKTNIWPEDHGSHQRAGRQDHPMAGLHLRLAWPPWQRQGTYAQHSSVGTTWGRGDILAWEYYEKPSSLSRVLRATTAYGWRSKMVTLNMECFRCHRNTLRQVSTASREAIMMKFMKKMLASWYSTRTVSNVVAEGSRHYYRKLRMDLEGDPPLNQSRTWTTSSKPGEPREVCLRSGLVGGEGASRKSRGKSMAGEEDPGEQGGGEGEV